MSYLKLNKLTLFSIYALTLTNIYAQRNTLYVIHTNNTNGALENCYCPDNPFGSVEKRSIYVRDFIKKNPNTILLDAGDFVTMSQQTLKDSLIAEAYGLLPYDAILYGDQELVLDARTLNRLRGQLGTTLVGTNIDRSDFFTSKVIRRKGLRIAVMGIMDPYAIKFYPEDVKKRIRLSDPIESVKNEMKKLSNKADIFILLTHQGYDLDVEFAKKIDGLDVIIGSHSQTKIESPKEINNALSILDAVEIESEDNVADIKEGPWMQEPISDGQKNFIESLITQAIDSKLDELAAEAKQYLASGEATKGNASQMIDKLKDALS